MSPAATMPRVRVDYTIPLWGVVALVLNLMLSGGTVIYMAGSFSQRLVAVEEQVRENRSTPETVARLDERTKAMQEQLTDIKSQLSNAHK